MMLCSLCPIVLGESGGRIVVSQKFSDNLVNKIMPVLEDLVIQLVIPDISGLAKGFQYGVQNFKIGSLTCANPKLTFLEGVGFLLRLENIALKGSALWDYKFKSWPHHPRGKGSVDVSSGSDSHVTAILKTVVVNERPQLQVQSMDVNIGSYKIKVKESKMYDWLYDIILKGWKNTIGKAINKAVEGLLTKEIGTLNSVLAGYSFTQVIPAPAPYDKSAIDFHITDIKALSDGLVADDHCEWYPTDGHPRYNGSAPVVPMTSFTDRQLKLEASSYLFDSAFYTFTSQNLLQYPVTPDLVPRSSPVSLTATTFAAFAPGLLEYAGDGITIHASTIPRKNNAAHSIDFQDGFMMATLPGTFDFNLMNSSLTEPAFTIRCPLLVASTLKVVGNGSDQSVVMNIKNASCEPLDVVHSAVGPVHANGWFSIEQALQLVISQILLPMANKALSAGVKLPSVEGVSLANTATVVGGGKLQIQTDFEFNFPRPAAPVYTWPKFADGSWLAQAQKQHAIFV